MGAKVFVDTNVLLRSLHKDLPLHSEALALIKEARTSDDQIWISRQILREYFVQVTRAGVITDPLTPSKCREQFRRIEATFKVANESRINSLKLLDLLETYPTAGKQIHDANRREYRGDDAGKRH